MSAHDAESYPSPYRVERCGVRRRPGDVGAADDDDDAGRDLGKAAAPKEVLKVPVVTALLATKPTAVFPSAVEFFNA